MISGSTPPRSPKLAHRAKVGPKWDRVYRYLRQQITQRSIAAGEYLPPESDLSKTLRVSIGTIRKAMHRLTQENYVRRKRGLGTQVSLPAAPASDMHAVLVLLGSIRQSFFAEIYSGIQAELDRQGYQPVLIATEGSAEEDALCIRRHLSHTRGLILMPSAGTQDRTLYEQLAAQDIPLVFVDRCIPSLRVDAVVSDNARGGYLATRCLMEAGHRKIALMTVTASATSMTQRVEGYRQALDEFGEPFDPGLVFRAAEGGYESSYELGRRIMDERPDATAVFCLRDDSAWGCMQCLADNGIRMPEEFSVVGYDDNEDICSRIRPRLTTIRQPKRVIGREAAKLLIRRIEGDAENKGLIISLPVELVPRESVGAPRQRALDRKEARHAE